MEQPTLIFLGLLLLEGGLCSFKGDPRNMGPESVITDTPGLGKAPSSLATPPTDKFVLEASARAETSQAHR